MKIDMYTRERFGFVDKLYYYDHNNKTIKEFKKFSRTLREFRWTNRQYSGKKKPYLLK